MRTNLFLEQWHRPKDDPHLAPASSIELHFLFNEDEERGGRPADETCDRFEIWNPDDKDGWTLSVSPVNDDTKELGAETEWEVVKLIVVIDSFFSMATFLGNIRLGLWWWWWWWGWWLWGRGGRRWTGVGQKILETEVCLSSAGWWWLTGTGVSVSWGGCWGGTKGALLKRAWPVLVRSSNEITLLNLVTAMSATAVQSISISREVVVCFCCWHWDSNFTSFSTLWIPADAASWRALSSIFAAKLSLAYPIISSTAMSERAQDPNPGSRYYRRD